MYKLRKWLFERYFPAAAKETISMMEREIRARDAEIKRLNAYIDGLETGMRFQRRVVINNNTGKG